MPTDSPVNVFIGCPQVLARLPDGPCLIVDADASLTESVQRQISVNTHEWPVRVVSAVLTSVVHETVVWHRFSDQRFNGVWTADEWSVANENLALVGSDVCESLTLCSILNDCEFVAGNLDFRRLNLYLYQGNPLQILDGCQHWLAYVTNIFFRYPRNLPIKTDTLLSKMKERFFRLSDEDSETWLFDQELFLESKFQNALRSLLDFELCRKLRPDLSALSDDDLATHFVFSNDTKSLSDLIRNHYNSVVEDLSASFSSLVHCFPFSAYRAARPDLDHLSDNDICKHYMRHGKSDDIDLRHSSLIEARLSELRVQCDHLQSLLHLCTRDFQDLQSLVFKNRLFDSESNQ